MIMELTVIGKPGFLGNILVHLLLFGVFIVLARFAYVITIASESCALSAFCFFSAPEIVDFVVSCASTVGALVVSFDDDSVWSTSRPEVLHMMSDDDSNSIKMFRFYSSVFCDLISGGYLNPESKSLCVETTMGRDVLALKEIGISDSVEILSKKAKKPLVEVGEARRIPFDDNTFEFVFSGDGGLEKSSRLSEFASEFTRTLKPEGLAVFHVKAKDTYNFNSFVNLCNCCRVVKSLDIDGFDSSMPYICEIILRKEDGGNKAILENQNSNGVSNGKCSDFGYSEIAGKTLKVEIPF